MHVKLKQESTGLVKDCKLGFSWTTFFFGFWVCVFRQDWKHMIIQIVAAMLTFGFSWLVFPFICNKMYVRTLLEKGYTPVSATDRDILVSKGIMAN